MLVPCTRRHTVIQPPWTCKRRKKSTATARLATRTASFVFLEPKNCAKYVALMADVVNVNYNIFWGSHLSLKSSPTSCTVLFFFWLILFPRRKAAASWSAKLRESLQPLFTFNTWVVVIASPWAGEGDDGTGACEGDDRTTCVTHVFPKKTRCKSICMSVSSFMHIADISEYRNSIT
jgi:hypothetical protein